MVDGPGLTTVDIPLRGGGVTHDRRLDRIGRYDDNSRNYQFRTLVELQDAGFPPAPGYEQLAEAVRAGRKPKVNRPATRTLDQGYYGACESFSSSTGLNASPIRLKPAATHDQTIERYFEIQRRDPYDGGEYPGANPFEGGTDTVTTMAYLKELGLIDSYWWCGAGSGTPEDDMVDALQRVGWVHLGIPWFYSMFEPRPDGRLEVAEDSGLAGYHAICSHSFRYVKLPGDKAKREYAVVQQSWGDEWGVKFYGVGGHALIAIEDLGNHLLPQRVWGEAAVPIQTLR